MPASTYDPALVDRICNRISEGATVKEACTAEGTSREVFREWRRRATDAGRYALNAYMIAREERATVMVDDMLDVAERCERGEIDAQAARVKIDTMKWVIARMNRLDWGDKTSHEHSGPDGGGIQVIIEPATSADGESTDDGDQEDR
ncbi:MAG: hypothetical protein Q8P46_12605 [Hyphomicrobiales bacterium]|nr:hypothetical protein [Hyphomicrobiales bacterium]